MTHSLLSYLCTQICFHGKPGHLGRWLHPGPFPAHSILQDRDSQGPRTLPVQTQALCQREGMCAWTRRKDSFHKDVKVVISYFLLIWLWTPNCKPLVLQTDLKKLLDGKRVLCSNSLVQRISTSESALKNNKEHKLFQTPLEWMVSPLTFS